MEKTAGTTERYIFEEDTFKRIFFEETGYNPNEQTLEAYRSTTKVINAVIEFEISGKMNGSFPPYIKRV